MLSLLPFSFRLLDFYNTIDFFLARNVIIKIERMYYQNEEGKFEKKLHH